MIEALKPIHIFRPGPHFNEAEAKRINEVLCDEFGNGQAWIHPGYSRSNIYHPPPDRVEMPRTQLDDLLFPGENAIKLRFPEEDYQIYCERVRQKLHDHCYPLLLFIDHTVREETLAFLQGFPFKVEVAIEVPTVEKKPIPWWGEPMWPKEAWGILASVLQTLGFSTIHLMGELGYYGYDAEATGCVHGARKAFAHFGFSTIILNDLIFPNADI